MNVTSEPDLAVRMGGVRGRLRRWFGAQFARFIWVAVPIMLFLSSMLMATAWLGHLKFKSAPFLVALIACWLIVLPEYVLNVAAVRVGKGIYSGATMASFHLCWGVICVVLVARFFLGEAMDTRQYAGFGLMLVAMLLIGSRDRGEDFEPKPETSVK